MKANIFTSKGNPPVSLEMITQAGFVKANFQQKQLPKRRPDYHDNYFIQYYWHASIFDLPIEQQLDQPWIEHRIWADKLKYDDVTEGRYGALRYSFRGLNDLHLFMRNFGYTYSIDGAAQPEENSLIS
ncbi:hypothetical protein IC229_05710 [Spirosoma sp. BT702]|uniref:Uncharacterized protein n=1 Tax=Spirosoma profusum TaxID=2771354 RepID=A0A927AQD2_9BACT|nr:hypothetical protein [Spirosoma profusum]MBD2700121.1 hypothetical protein [Spirosoma profusum]